jgi:hypothetical protein
MPNFNDSMKAKVAPAAINTGLDRPAGTGSTNDLLYTLWGGSTGSINDAGNTYFNTASGPAFRSASSTTTTSSTMTCAMPTGTTAGDILVMTIWGFFDPKAGTYPTNPSGWTSRADVTNSSGDGYFWRVLTKTAGASESSVTQTGTNWWAGSMTVLAVSGGTAVDVFTYGGGSGGPNLVVGSITTTTSTDLLIGTWVAERNLAEQTITAPATMTSRVTTSVTNSYRLTSNVATQTLSASGATGTRTATIPLYADYAYYALLAVK